MKKILILAANPTDTSKLRLDEEVREIENAHRQATNRAEIEIISKWAVRVDDLRRELLHHKPNIVHFCGHGTGDDGLLLENQFGQKQFVSSESLANLFKLFKNDVECVVMNACYSEVQAEAIHEYINCVIGMNYKIGDKAAIEFATGFYDALTNGRNYQDSFEFGKNALDLESIPESGIPQIKIRDNTKSLLDADAIYSKSNEENKMTGERNINIGSGNYNERIEGDYIQGNYYNSPQKQNLAEAAAEIQELLKQLDKSYDTNSYSGKIQVADETIKTLEKNPELKARIISALKVGGVKAFEQFLSHPAASFVIGALEDWQNNN
ncbi:CHAT domain-containing protein [Rivularia sp. UHCC 0363]|uniref:CHAT domain-containing protein n=1 Tax=Rivularia sp. UHCC 0363 TaxID=3110244 RepID=UPI002B2107A9|nr:CHAT domain-containing protein [Rivularia sp. UHCC 0363]MEA5595338.1 CHAT domain-containing protein [Rivularia sp. UHCC 0363]